MKLDKEMRIFRKYHVKNSGLFFGFSDCYISTSSCRPASRLCSVYGHKLTGVGRSVP